MSAGLHVSPYFIFRNDPEVSRIRIGNFEYFRDDREPEPETRYSGMYYTQYLVTEISEENGEKIVYLRRD